MLKWPDADNMDEDHGRGNLQGNVVRQSGLQLNRSLKSTLSGRSTPRGSPSFRRLHSSRTPQREIKVRTGTSSFIQDNRFLLWLLLITSWAYLGFYIQSRWVHSDNDGRASFLGYQSGILNDSIYDYNNTVARSSRNTNVSTPSGSSKLSVKWDQEDLSMGVHETRPRNRAFHKNTALWRSRRFTMEHRVRGTTMPLKRTIMKQRDPFEEIPINNASYGQIFGPFDKTEDRILGWSPSQRTGTCNRKGDFAHIVWSRKFLLILHELSMTGAPLSMVELATELMSCGATVSAVVLNKRGGLMGEILRRGIRVLPDKGDQSYKIAMKSDFIIAGSAVCESWIGKYFLHFPGGSSKISWWIMENRRQYFDRSKHMLGKVKMLMFLSMSQLQQWLAWCDEEHIMLKTQPLVVPLSVNDELAFVAGIPCSLNTPSFSTEKMLEKRMHLRAEIRKQMGLTDNDMLVTSLSSINPAKGQLLLLHSAFLTTEDQMEKRNSVRIAINYSHSDTDKKQYTEYKKLYDKSEQARIISGEISESELSLSSDSPKGDFSHVAAFTDDNTGKNLSNIQRDEGHIVMVLVGSVGSKSNKVQYVKEILQLLSEHSNFSKQVLWTPTTTRVAALYSAADVYVINSQGLGETFGRVTIEAMAFGLPVLGTDAGGTREIVKHNLTGLLHPIGHEGIHILAEHLKLLQHDVSVRQQMGMRGRDEVFNKFLKNHMYQRLAKVLTLCMRI